MEAKQAIFEKTLKGFKGNAALYKLQPPMSTDAGVEHEYVVVSAVDVVFSGPETYIFPADGEGALTSWGELAGSMRGTLSHSDALANAGYSIVATDAA